MITRIEVSTPDIENTYLDIDPETKHGFLIDPGASRSRRFSSRTVTLTISERSMRSVRSLGILPSISMRRGFGIFQAHFSISRAPWAAPSRWRARSRFRTGLCFRCSRIPRFRSGRSMCRDTQRTARSFIQNRGYAFSGDTVFQGAVGATHFPGGDDEKLASSIRDRVLTLPPETKFYPGHGEPTVLSREIPLLRRVAGLREIP